MSGLFGGGRTVNQSPTAIAGLQIQTSAYGGAVPIVYGTNRVAAMLIDFDDFTAIPQTTKQGAGKGGTIVTTNYTYTVMTLLLLAEGQIAGVNACWADKDKGTLALFGWTLFDGSQTQSPFGYLVSHHPAKAINYSGSAYVAAAALSLGAQGTMKNNSFEVEGLLVGGTGGIAGQDAEPADFIPDFLTNALFGAGWDSSRIGNVDVGQGGTVDSSFRRYTQATGFFSSPAITDQRTAAEHLADFLVATNSAAVFSEGVLKFIPYGDQPITGNGVTFTPYTTPIYDITPDELIVDGPDTPAITVSRAPLEDSFNTIPVEYCPRVTVGVAADYNPSVVQDPEAVDADLYGVRQGSTLSLHAITRAEHASQISRIQAQQSIYIRNRYTFTLPWRYILLDPMDLVTLTDPTFGLDRVVVRIKDIQETDAGALQFTAEEWPFGSATGALYDVQENDGYVNNTAIDPGNATAPLIFDVPMLAARQLGDVELAIATAGGQWWGGAEVWLSYDGVTYELQGAITKKAAYGVTTATFAAGSGFDTTNTLSVNLLSSLGDLSSVSDQSAQDLLSLCYVDGELVAPAIATLTGSHAYNLTRIQRAALGTFGVSHSSGTPFARFDDAVFRVVIPPSRIGSTVYVKLASFNIYGGGRQDLASVSATTHVPTAVGLTPPYPDTVTLAITGTQPTTSASTTLRAKALENDSFLKVDDNGTDGVIEAKSSRYVTVDWTPVVIYPSSLLTGYEIVLFTGSDPNDVSSYLVPKLSASSDAQAAIVTLSGNTAGSVTINAAVRAIYTTDPSSWRTSSGTVVASPGTVPLNVPLSMVLSQVSSTRDTVTFTVTVGDPLGKYTSGTVDVAWTGLTSVLDNQTGLPVAASFTATYGVAYSFTATLNPVFRGGGFVKFNISAAGRGEGFVAWFAAQADQDAAPSTEMSMDNAGATSIAVNAPDNTATLKWLASTAGYPSVATVIASGTVQAGGSPFLFSLGITAALGDTVYFTGVPYDTFGVAGVPIQCQKYRETVIASKTVQFVAAQLVPSYGVVGTDYTVANGGVESLYSKSARFDGSFVLPDGCTITDLAIEYWQLYTQGGGTSSTLSLYRQSDGADIADVGGTIGGAAWVTSTASLSQLTTGERFTLSAQILDFNFTTVGPGNSRIRAIFVTYSSPNTQATV